MHSLCRIGMGFQEGGDDRIILPAVHGEDVAGGAALQKDLYAAGTVGFLLAGIEGKEGKIEGFILHSNAVADMDFEAVAVAKKWMAEHGDEEI